MSLGLPAATQILMEIGAFGAAAVLAGRLSPVAYGRAPDCHQLRVGHLHGAAGRFIGGCCCGGPGDRTR